VEIFRLFGTISINKASAIKDIKAVNAAGSSFGTKMGNVFKKIGKVAKVAFAAIGVAAAGIFVKAIKSAAEFEQAMAMVQAVTGATAEEFDEMNDKAKQLGRDTKFSMTEIAEGMEFLGRAGFETTEIIAAMDGVTALAASQMMDLGRASDITSNILTGFGLSADEAERTANLLAATAASANVNVEMLGETMKYIAPLASAARWSLEETAAAAGKLGDAGIQASMAGTSLRMAIASLMEAQSGESPLNEALDKLNLSIDDLEDSEGNLLSLAEVMGVLKGAGADAGNMLDMFGKRAGPAMTILLNEGQASLEAYTKQLTGTDAAFEQMAIQLDTLEGQWTVMKGSISLLFQTLGESMMPVLKDLLKNHIIPLINRTQEWVESIGGIRGMMGHAIIAVGNYLIAAADWIESHEYIRIAVEGVWNIMKDLWSFVKNVFVGDWSAAWENIKSIASESTNVIIALISQMWDMLPISDETKAKIIGAFNNIMDAAKLLVATVIGAFSDIETDGRTILDKVVSILATLLDAVASVINFLIDHKEATAAALAAIAAGFIAIKSVQIAATFVALLNPVNLIIAAFAALSAGIVLLVKNWDTVKAFLVDMVTKFFEWGQSVDQMIIDGLESGWDAVVSWFDSAWNTVKDTTTSALSQIAGYFSDMSSLALQWGKDLLIGFKDGIVAGAVAVKDAVVDVANSVIGWFKGVLGIESPSTVFYEIGENTTKGFIDGLKSKGQELINVGKGMVNAVVAAIYADAERMEAAGASVGEAAGEATGEAYAEAVNRTLAESIYADAERMEAAGRQVTTTVAESIYADAERMEAAGESIPEGIASGIEEGTPEVVDAVTGLSNTAISTISNGFGDMLRSIVTDSLPIKDAWNTFLGSMVDSVLNSGIESAVSWFNTQISKLLSSPLSVFLAPIAFGMTDPEVTHQFGQQLDDTARELISLIPGIDITNSDPGVTVTQNANAATKGGGTNINMDGMYNGATINVRSDQDIEALARSNYDLMNSRLRAEGVRA
jgi:TP901 family phage tail tape measure protein